MKFRSRSGPAGKHPYPFCCAATDCVDEVLVADGNPEAGVGHYRAGAR